MKQSGSVSEMEMRVIWMRISAPLFTACTFTTGAVADAEAPERLAARSLLADVTAMVTGVGRREGMTGSGRSPGRLLPLATGGAEEQVLLPTPL